MKFLKGGLCMLKLRVSAIIAAVAAVFFISPSFTGNNIKTQTSTSQDAKLKWYTIEEAMEMNKKAPRKFFIDVYTQWCGWCKKMDATTFSNSIIADYLSKKYYPVKFDAENTDTVYFKNKAYPFVASGFRGYNQLAYDWVDGRLSYPTIVFLDEQANTIQAIAGYREAEELDKILKFFGEDYYRNTDYGTFLANYKSPFSSSQAPAGGQ
ncbi:MAG TPA: DUF255 domain-containing protein [Chitinophagales bacterium]|nr:DUF255 domain-containing protein [Chitinophagales bacterium]